jgi:hypothetical protein
MISDYTHVHKQAAQTPTIANKGESKMQALKTYFDKHQETCITLALIVIVDYFIFDGMFQEKIKSMMENAIGTVEKKLSPKDKETQNEETN